MSTITINERELGIFAEFPHPELIPVKPIADALTDVVEAVGIKRERRRTLQAAHEDKRRAVEAAEREATDAQIESGKLPKGLRKPIAAADEAIEEAKLGFTAAERSVTHYWTILKARVEAHAAEWHKLALKDAEAAIGKVTSYRRSLVGAQEEAKAALGVLSMLERDDKRFVLDGGKAPMLVSTALDTLTDAIGDAVLAVEAHKRAEVSHG